MRSATLFSILLTGLIPLVSIAQVPLNSTCATAFELPVSPTNATSDFMYVDSRRFSGAVPDPVTTCSGSNSNSHIGWYKFTATATRHWVRTEGPKVDSHIIEVLSGSCGSFTPILCMTPQSAYQPLTGLSIGSTYYIRVIVQGECVTGNSNCDMGLAVVSDPPHDECAGAIQLTVKPSQVLAYPGTEVATIGATQSQPGCEGDAGASDDDVWYRFTATGPAHHFPFKVMQSTGVPVIQWFSGSCGALNSLVCDGTTATGLTPGQEYHIRVYSESDDPGSNIRLVGDVYESAANDECSGAIPIAVALSGEEPQEVSVTTLLGTSSTVPCGMQNSDVWLTFTAPTATVALISSEGNTFGLYSGSCGSLICEWPGTSNSEEELFEGLTPGATYFLKVGRNLGFGNTRIRLFATPANDECGTAMPLNVLPSADAASFTPGSNIGGTQGPAGCSNNTPVDVWYSFTASSSTQLLYAHPTLSNAQLQTEVLSGPCGSTTSIFCGQMAGAARTLPGLTPGATYLVRVYGTYNFGRGVFSLGITDGLSNDECDGATELPVLSPMVIMDQPPVHLLPATAGSGAASCGNNLNDLWYRFTPTSTEATFLAAFQYGSTSSLPGVNIELLSGTCGNLTSISCAGNGALERAHVRYTGLVPGTEYHLRYAVTSLNTAPMRPAIMEVPANDEITGAAEAPKGANFTQPLQNGAGYGATPSLPALCNSADTDDDTWYHFIASATAHSVRAVTRNTLFAEVGTSLSIEVFDTLSTIPDTLEAHNIGCGSSTVNLTGLTVGHDYWYRVFTYGNAASELCMFATWYTDGNNDEAAGAAELEYGDTWSYYFNTTGATNSLPDADCLVDDNANDDIWFKFTANGSPARLIVGYHTADLTVELFSGTSGNLTSVACSDNVMVLPALTAGQTYYARVYSWGSAPVEGRIGLFTTPSLTANTCVDEDCLDPVLIANPSIEQGEYCLGGFLDLGDTEGIGITLAPGWPRVGFGSSDAYSSCLTWNARTEMPSNGGTGLNRMVARSGKGMAGILLKEATNGYREYIQTELTEPLVAGEPYLVSFNAVLAPGGQLALNGIGAYMSEGAPIQDYYVGLDVHPQVIGLEPVGAGRWTTICGVVVPDAAYDHITIGSFFVENQQYTYVGNAASDAYYFIDDVVVAHINDANCITGIGDVPSLDEDATASGDALRVYPNPANDRVNIVCGAGLFGKRGVIEVFDVTGQRVHAEQVPFLNALQPLELSSEWKEGLYLVMLRVEGQSPRSARVVVRR